MEYYLLVCVCLFCCVLPGACTLSEPIKRSSSECFGNSLSMTCDLGYVIAIEEIRIGAHKSSIACPITATAGTDPSCCLFAADDCLFTLDTENHQQYHEDCNGRLLCSPQVLNVALSPEKCGFADVSQYPATTHYMSVDYYCIPESRIGSMCNVTKTVQASTVYLWNSGFPISRIPASTGCSCSIEADDCAVTIQTTTIQRMLESKGTCEQLLSLKDETGTELSRWDCANNTVTLATTSTSSSYITYTLQNNRTVDDGYFWIGFSVTSPSTARLSVNCPNIPRATTCNAASIASATPAQSTIPTTTKLSATFTHSLITSTTTLMSTDRQNKATTTPSDDKALSDAHIIIICVFVIILIVCIVASCVIYKSGIYKRCCKWQQGVDHG